MIKDATSRREQIMNMLPATAKEIEIELGYSYGGSFTQINNLLRQNRIIRKDNTYYKVK